jgi:hypothetical protein
MPGPAMPSNSGAEFYGPGNIEREYERIQHQPELPSVAPPTGSSAGPPPEAFIPATPIDPNAPDILDLIKGGRFDPPFTITMTRRDGIQTFKSDAGTKTETKYALSKETIRTPADLLRVRAGVTAEIYKPLNNMTLEFQLMLYLAYKNKALDVPSRPPVPAVQEEATADLP